LPWLARQQLLDAQNPTNTRNSLSGMSRFRLLTAVTLPYRLTTFSKVTDAMGFYLQ
jgi:hypothetical protein